jgi:hypothetical protein
MLLALIEWGVIK